jgi:lysophospholipase L1-like esterase
LFRVRISGNSATHRPPWLRWLYPNLSGLAKQVRAHFNPILDINASWQRQAQAIQHSLSPEERRRYETLDPEVRDQFERGLFNPFQVHLALRHPSSFLEATRSENDTKAQSLMAASLREVADVAAAQASRVIVVSIPYPLYFSKAALASQHRVGFQVSESMVISDIPESTIQQACKQAGLTSLEISPFFRTQASTNSLFFPLDGHLNAAGHQLLAETLAAQLEPTLQAGR